MNTHTVQSRAAAILSATRAAAQAHWDNMAEPEADEFDEKVAARREAIEFAQWHLRRALAALDDGSLILADASMAHAASDLL